MGNHRVETDNLIAQDSDQVDVGTRVPTGRIRLTVTRGKLLYSPISFHTFEVGPVTFEVEIESLDDASAMADRLLEVAKTIQRASYVSSLDTYVKQCAHAAGTVAKGAAR